MSTSKTMVEHARYELDLLGEEQGFAAALVATIGAYTSWGHSGGSHECAVDLLVRLLNGDALTPLTADPDEWEDRSELSNTPMWQNVRDAKAFSADGGLSYTLLGPGYGKILLRSDPPPWWIKKLVDEHGLNQAAAVAAVEAYLRFGRLDDADRASLDPMSEAQRDRYMAQRWGDLGQKTARMLYQPPGKELEEDDGAAPPVEGAGVPDRVAG